MCWALERVLCVQGQGSPSPVVLTWAGPCHAQPSQDLLNGAFICLTPGSALF